MKIIASLLQIIMNYCSIRRFSICSTVDLVLCEEGLFCHVGKNV